MSKALLAFLGTNNYTPCNYFLDEEKKIDNVRFIQEALISLFCKNWTIEDRIIIFLTEQARESNWVDNGHRKGGKSLQLEGLKRRLEQLTLRAKLIPVGIPKGQTKQEIWDIFNIIFNQINNNDEIIFDITHALRSLPMLTTIILNYAKVIKNIKIKGVYYGAFDVLGYKSEVEKMRMEDRNAPIFNLTSFISLFDWTNAINNFIIYGDAQQINELSQAEIKPILKETRGENKKAQSVRRFMAQLENLSKIIQTCRGLKLIKEFNFDELQKLIDENRDSFIKPMNPLLDKISVKIKDFKNADIKNGYAAVEWCIKHNLIQQGYTILQETIISEKVIEHFGIEGINDINNRELVVKAYNAAIKTRSGKKSVTFEDGKSRKDEATLQKIIKSLDEKLVRIYDSISQSRNDINHASFRPNSHKPAILKNKLKKYYENIKSLNDV
ncbi:MAG: TIGR02221 family CRISPR-associated protein [Candidatus Helarchaeota archaeon]